MKKSFLFFAALLLATSSFAQKEDATSIDELQQARQKLAQKLHHRLPNHHDFPVMEASSSKGAKGVAEMRSSDMPANRWFPGEWDEVKAIVVTCSYSHYPASHDNDLYWEAEPILTGVAQYYHYVGGDWNVGGMGPYVSHPDTSNSSFANVFFYLMDGIQQGGAEAWVRVESLADSSCIKRKLNRMGLRSDNMRFIEAPGNSFWFRDCGPICFYYGDQDSVAMLDFMYYPGRALDDSLPSAIQEKMGIPNYITDIEWEGGNCLVDGAGLVMSSDAIYSGNQDRDGQIVMRNGNIYYSTKPSLSQAQVRDSLTTMMGPRCKILPKFRYDGGTGHIDLYADMWTETDFVFSKFPGRYANWYDAKVAVKNIDSMTSWQTFFGGDSYFTKRYIPFPCTDNGGAFTSQTAYNNNFTRTYSNHTFVNKTILQPCFSPVVNGEPSKAWDKERIDSLRAAYPGYTIYPINVSSFDGSGGAIHCITKQIPADNPIRFIHKAILGNTGNAYYYLNAEIESVIRNRSGISNAKIFWRCNGSQWFEAPMVPDNNSGIEGLYKGVIPTTLMNDYFPMCDTCSTLIEYYIEATSNNGKTMTKPITADQGGYFAFAMGSDDSNLVQIERVELDGVGQFYPNPATSQAHIRMDLGNGGNYNVSIVDVTGRAVYSGTLNASGSIVYTVETSHLSNGIYNVVFENNDARIVRKLVVR